MINLINRNFLYLYKSIKRTIMKILSTIIIIVLFAVQGFSQDFSTNIMQIENEISNLNSKKDSLYSILEEYKLEKLKFNLEKFGLPELEPGDTVIKHAAMELVYSEANEQAKWVAHIITPDIAHGRLSRTNDFRPDTAVKTGSAVEKDYFIKTQKADGSYAYDGFGFDRGHLAPSADFRWSATAISESYLYSNMSPQRPDFNRGGWAKLEDLMRGYVIENNTALMVVTGPVLTDSMAVVTRSINQVSIPKYFFKVAYDSLNKVGIGFIMPNEKIMQPIETYAVTIDSVEKLTGINFYAGLPDNIENKMERDFDVSRWLPKSQQDDVLPLDPSTLKRNCFNSLQAKKFIDSGTKVTICGTVVSAFKSRKGNIFLNIDKKFPNQIFTVTIFSSNVVNFSYDPSVYLKDKKICVKGKISEFNGTPSMIVENENQIKLFNERL